MEYRSGAEGDFLNIETFVWQAIFPAFNHSDLSEQQRAENDEIVEAAEGACLSAVALPERQVIVAYDSRQRRLAGFIILDRSSADYPEISWIIVSRKYWGSGVADGLISRGIEWLGTKRPIKTSFPYFLERTMAFFSRYGFEDTGETAGDFRVPRRLLLREAGPLVVGETENPEQLSIAVEEAPEPPVHNPLEPTESEQSAAPTEEIAADLFSEQATAPPPSGSKYQDIEFEIDYGESESTSEAPAESPVSGGLDFEFAFDSIPAEEPIEEEEEDLIIPLDLGDFKVAGETQAAVDSADAEAEIEIESDLEEEAEIVTEAEVPIPPKKEPKLNTGEALNGLRRAFQDYFMEMVTDLFGNRSAVDYWQLLQDSDFRELVDNSLRQYQPGLGTTFSQLAGDLAEYFIVEIATELHGGVFPQRLLRHQTKSLAEADLFTLISDYLDLSNERERVDSDFITIAPKRLRNATKNFLLAGPGERIFFLIDQSMLGNLKHGFALTDRGFYWKAMLQPNHALYFTESPRVSMQKGAITANGHFFDTGKKAFNLKIILLLKKLGRLFENEAGAEQ